VKPQRPQQPQPQKQPSPNAPLSKGEQFAAVMEFQELARAAGVEESAWCRHDLSWCMSNNPKTAAHYITRARQKLNMVLMRAALRASVPQWEDTPRGAAVIIGLETSTRRPLTMPLDQLIEGVMLICGSSLQQQTQFLTHVVLQLRRHRI
jgi:hypothetical protein